MATPEVRYQFTGASSFADLNTEAAFYFSLSVSIGSNVPQFFPLPRLTFSLPWGPDMPTQLKSETIPSMAKTEALGSKAFYN